MFISSPLYSLDSETRYAFSVEPQLGFLWGKGSEIVYAGNYHFNSSPYVSELSWDFKPLFYTGLSLDFSPRYPFSVNGFHISLGIKYGLPLNTGIIENRDWLATGHDYLTHYSKHDAFSWNSSFIAQLSLGYSFSLFNRILIKPYTELSFMRFSWEARDGYMQYGNSSPGIGYEPTSPNQAKLPFFGTVNTYSQNWVIFAPGIEAGIRVNDYFSVLLGTSITPLLYGFHRDEHLDPSKRWTFLDYTYGGLYINGTVKLEYILGRKFTLSISAAYMNLSKSRGDTEISRNGAPYTFHPDIAGAAFSFFDYTLSLRYIF